MMLASRDIEEYGCIKEAFKNVKLILDPAVDTEETIRLGINLQLNCYLV